MAIRCPMCGRHGTAGFTLVEVLVAMLLVATMAAGTTALFTVAVDSSRRARGRTSATVLAVQKIEQLRALTWAMSGDGPLTDSTTDVSRNPPTSGGAGLGPSPAGSLAVSVSGYADYLDEMGRWVGTGVALPARAVWARRWSVRPAASDADTVIVEARVIAIGRSGIDVHLVSVKTRKSE